MTLNLNHEGFEKNLVTRRDDKKLKGVQYIFRFDNDYGASVIKHLGSYGHWEDLWELAVIFWDDDRWCLTYDTEITDDVIGYLTDDEVRELLGRIKAL